eukprot:9487221-Pyramimonas_sp.AAC.1
MLQALIPVYNVYTVYRAEVPEEAVKNNTQTRALMHLHGGGEGEGPNYFSRDSYLRVVGVRSPSWEGPF